MASNQPPSAQPVQPTPPSAVAPRRFQRRPALLTSAIIAAIPWLVLFGVLIYQTDWHYFVDWLIAGGITTFAFFLGDKVFAKTGASRVPEAVLMGLIVFGGVIGGWLGMLLFRHKIAHQSFWAILIVASIIWAAAGIWWFFLR